MRYRLVWDHWARTCLATVWLAANNPQRFTDEVAEFEGKVLSNPSGAGWPWQEAVVGDKVAADIAYRAGKWPTGLRIMRLSEAVVAFSVSEDDRTVWVWSIRVDPGDAE